MVIFIRPSLLSSSILRRNPIIVSMKRLAGRVRFSLLSQTVGGAFKPEPGLVPTLIQAGFSLGCETGDVGLFARGENFN